MIATPTPDILETARLAHAHGLCVIPANADKSPFSEWNGELGKRTWDHFKTTRPAPERLEAWFGAEGRTALGIVCGAVSGGLELLEFEEAAEFDAFQQLAIETGNGELLARLADGYLEQSGGGGIHLLFRSDACESNTKLAARPKRENELTADDRDKIARGKPAMATLAETRGEGGFCVIAPSAGLHANGTGYVLLRGGLATIPNLTADERAALLHLARLLDRTPRHDPASEWGTTVGKSRSSNPADSCWDVTPLDDFKRRASWADVLTGWTPLFERDGLTYWRRPGKAIGISATTGARSRTGKNLMVCFSTSTALPANESLSTVGAYAHLNCRGDFIATYKALAQLGYGVRKPQAGRKPGTDGASTGRTPPPRAGRDEGPDEQANNGFRLDARKAGSYRIRPVKYLARPRLPRGIVMILAGLGGEGKSTLVENVAADLSCNRPTLGAVDPFGEPVDVLILAGEDGREDSLIPRLIAAGADLDRIEIIEGLVNDNGKHIPFDITYLPYLRRHIEEGAAQGRNYKLVIVDPLATYVGRAKIDDHRDAQLKPALEELARIAQELDITFLCLAHLNKGGNTKSSASFRVMGGAAYVTSARLAFIYGTDPDDPARRILASPKANLPGGKPPALAVRIAPLDPAEAAELLRPHVEHLDQADVAALSGQLYRLTYDGTVDSTAEQILDPDDKPKQAANHIDAAAEWLSERLANGPVCSTIVAMEGAPVAGRTWPTAGVTNRHIKIATEIKFWRESVLKARLGGRSRKFGMQGEWFFWLENTAWPPSLEAIQAAKAAGQESQDPAGPPKTTPEHGHSSSDSLSSSSSLGGGVFFKEDKEDKEDASSSKKTKKTVCATWGMTVPPPDDAVAAPCDDEGEIF